MELINGEWQFDSELEAKTVLESEGDKLLKIAIDVWRKYLSSYSPKEYVRTGKSQASIKLGKVKKLDEETLGIELTFEDDLTYHDSVIGNGNPQGHSIMLISSGWHVKKGKHMSIYRFGYYEGFDYIGQLTKEYEKSKHNGISLEILWSGKYLR